MTKFSILLKFVKFLKKQMANVNIWYVNLSRKVNKWLRPESILDFRKLR